MMEKNIFIKIYDFDDPAKDVNAKYIMVNKDQAALLDWLAKNNFLYAETEYETQTIEVI